ncbi:MAG TPA: hypothetical protein VFY68_09405 [Nitrososphaeraceae archaeon]|nr:hypothetical protein [Nitrososphaeraceae archaeon]
MNRNYIIHFQNHIIRSASIFILVTVLSLPAWTSVPRGLSFIPLTQSNLIIPQWEQKALKLKGILIPEEELYKKIEELRNEEKTKDLDSILISI